MTSEEETILVSPPMGFRPECGLRAPSTICSTEEHGEITYNLLNLQKLNVVKEVLDQPAIYLDSFLQFVTFWAKSPGIVHGPGAQRTRLINKSRFTHPI